MICRHTQIASQDWRRWPFEAPRNALITEQQIELANRNTKNNMKESWEEPKWRPLALTHNIGGVSFSFHVSVCLTWNFYE